MAARTERKNTRRWINGKVLGGLVGTLIAGLAAPANAQTCNPAQAAKLLASDGAAYDNFGTTVSISGNTAVIGAPTDGDNGPNSGSAYFFTRTGGVWTQQAKILPDDGAEGEWFGTSVSIDGDTAIIGATWWVADDIRPGSVYVFTRTGGVWTQQAKLLPDDGAVDGEFGDSVSINGDTVVIGAPYDDENGTDYGAAYVFTRTGGVWTQQAKTLPNDGTEDSRGRFGQSVAVSGDTIVISSHRGNSITMFGSAFVFTRNQGVWTQQAKLQGSDRRALDDFGKDVAIDGDTLIGSSGGWSGGLLGAGLVYVFTRTGGIWTEQAQLLADDRAAGDRFGYALSIDGDTAVVGAPYDDDNGNWSGSAYLFSRTGGVWTQQAKILPADGAANDLFGITESISVSGDTAIIGVMGVFDSLNSESAYVFDLGCAAPCPVDLTGDGIVDVLDFFEFIRLFNAGDPAADLTGNGIVDVLDFFEFIRLFDAGCP